LRALDNRAMKRKIIYGFGMTIDGYIARKDDSMDYLKMTKEGEAVMMEFFSKIDTIVMGRRTFTVSRALQKEENTPEMPGMVNYVFSRSMKPGKRKGYEVVRGPLKPFVARLRARKGKDIYLAGGGQLARSFLRADLVDELFIGLVPIMLGDGLSAFPPSFPQRDFKLTECKAYADGSIALRYARVRSKPHRAK